MGFFQSLFHKEKGSKKDSSSNVNKTLPPITTTGLISPLLSTTPSRDHQQEPNTTLAAEPNTTLTAEPNTSYNGSKCSSILLPASPPPTSPVLQKLKSSSSIRTNNSSKTPISLSPPISQRASQDIMRPTRFQLYEDGTHTHHLTLPATNRITASLNGLVTGIANKSLRLTQWTERKITMDEILKERASLNRLLHRNDQDTKQTLERKWGTCQETIGKGTSGVVRVVHKVEGTAERLYAVKELRKRNNESPKDYVTRLTSEYYISSTMDHINVIKTFDLLPLNDTSPIFAQVMEYSGGGDLFDVLYDCPDGLEVAEANCFFKQLMRGVTYLHSIGVAHRDLKPENLLLTSTGCIKITDFGSAACFKGTTMDSDGEEDDDEEDCSKIHLIRGLVGSEPYIAPEEFTDLNYDARLVDVWSCGIIYMAIRKATHLWQVAKAGEDESYDRYLKFRQLLDEERENARKEHIARKNLEKSLSDEQRQEEKAKRDASILKARETIRRRAKEGRFDTLDGIDIQAKKIIYRMLDPLPQKRITANEVLESDWCQRIYCCQPCS